MNSGIGNILSKKDMAKNATVERNILILWPNLSIINPQIGKNIILDM